MVANGFEFNLERAIDDFVLMCYLIGNDFLPHLPGFDIITGALNDMLDIYAEMLPVWGDYMTLLGEVDLERLSQFLQKMSHVEKQLFEREAEARGIELGDDSDTGDDSGGEQGKLEGPGQGGFSEEYKQAYYARKFGLSKDDAEGHLNLRQKYVEGILWCFSYYYSGCISWGWYFNYHHTPFVSDLKDLEEMEISFELGKAFLPFQQLLGVLPIASRKLLPEPYADLMDRPSSKLNQAGFYPLEFEVTAPTMHSFS